MDRAPLLASIAAGIATLLLPAAVLALEVPTLEGRVNDRAGLLSVDARAGLERELARYETSSGHQFAVLTVPSLEGEALEDFSVRVAQQWRLGRKGKDDGLLLFVVAEPHAVRVEVGYGLEPAITDALSGRVIRNVIVPAFRAGDYAGGIRRGLERLMEAASTAETGGGRGSAPASAGPHRWSNGQKAALLLVLMFLGPLVAVVVFAGIFMAFNRGGRLNHLLGPARGLRAGADEASSSGGSSDDSSSSGSSGGDFSGGGGSFGGGGASGSW